MKLESIKTLLLSLLFSQKPPDNNSLAALEDEDWATLMSLVTQHRLGPYMYWRLTRELDGYTVPQSVHAQLENQFRNSVLRSLSLQRELLQLHRILTDADVPYIALKGAYLAFNCYPHAAMRPMRDVDFLVVDDQALDVFNLLLDHGYQTDGKHHGNLDAMLQARKHLPPLFSPFGKVWIELHNRLSEPGQQGGNRELQSTNEGLWSRRIFCELAGSSIPFLSPTDLLLHLCVHAVYDHAFNNGPLTISDLSFLIGKQDIDWQLFWQLAANEGWSKGCLLILKMTEHYDGGLDICWPGDNVESPTEELVQASCRLALRDYNLKGNTKLMGELSNLGFSQKLEVLFRRIFPTRLSMSLKYPAPQDSFKIFFYYPQHCVRVIFKRCLSVLVSLQNQGPRREADAISRLTLWLRNPSS